MAAIVMEGKDVSSLTKDQLTLEESTSNLEANQLLEDTKWLAEEAKIQADQQTTVDVTMDGKEDPAEAPEIKKTAENKKVNPTRMKICKEYIPKGKQISAQQNGMARSKMEVEETED
ncbi:hypothetical protein MJO29_006927 [Puccinia striiformis f. sp. tritici]|uniref:Uncharacterized protein n=2 Tax=Puccinia striiformis f. sp. tritici TaxID=168172 RepID=A0A0L0VHR0_9BASI|nr:hypothetical protein MJO29_006927 [Puccinia striiformis f. sp. tritici]KNE98504.1 hypothetical protein PSTG_08243 [Puccinia striiformis f. sp. tritici PST-78]